MPHNSEGARWDILNAAVNCSERIVVEQWASTGGKGGRLTPTLRGRQATELSSWKKWTIRLFVTISKNTKWGVTAEVDWNRSDLIQSKQTNFTWWKVVRLLLLFKLLSAEARDVCLTHPFYKESLCLQINVLIYFSSQFVGGERAYKEHLFRFLGFVCLFREQKIFHQLQQRQKEYPDLHMHY